MFQEASRSRLLVRTITASGTWRRSSSRAFSSQAPAKIIMDPLNTRKSPATPSSIPFNFTDKKVAAVAKLSNQEPFTEEEVKARLMRPISAEDLDKDIEKYLRLKRAWQQ